jgi:hypothetical protein
VSRAQQLPFTVGGDPSSASKATCTAGVFDLAEDRLSEELALFVMGSSALGRNLPSILSMAVAFFGSGPRMDTFGAVPAFMLRVAT